MSTISELYQMYASLDTGDLSSNQKKQMYLQLSAMKTDDIQTLDEHKQFIELLRMLRQASMNDMELFGQKFLATLKSLLSVGEDGVYTNQLRFLYELIQNVDDCDYLNISDCNLDIQFKYEAEPGQIILTYNETGFTPENVFAITGIAEKSKNISADKVEIGEKGIGFKSIFGIAKKVRIESGKFSFELNADNFTVPIPSYDEYIPIFGTRLTLEMSAKECQGIYRSLVDQYLTPEAMLNQNPILFLNKLTHLKMYFDDDQYIEFDVQRTVPELHGDLIFETNASVSVDMKDCYNGRAQSIKKEIECYRYTMPITYGKKECIARYGADTSFSERKHNLIAVFPVLPEDMIEFKGVLYSFLPTQVKTTAPIILHVPYKLGGSREYVDSHNNDAWFMFTNQKLVDFLEKIYLDFSHIIKQKIIRYIPNRHNFFFRGNKGKVGCIMTSELKADYICSKKIFYSEEGTFEDIKSIVSFGVNEFVDDPIAVHKLLDNPYKLFVPGYPVDMNSFGCKVIVDVPGQLFRHGLEKSSSLNEILGWLEKNVPGLSYYSLLYKNEPTAFTEEHLKAVALHGQLWNASIQSAQKQIIQKNASPMCTLKGIIPEIDESAKALLSEIIKDAELDKNFKSYLKRIKDRFYVIDSKREFAVAANNGIALAKGSELGSFAKLARLFDRHGTFTASIEIRQASERLNQIDESMSNQEYLSLLHGVRKSLMDAFGTRMYNSYIKVIAEAGTDKNRFLSELLQNADDCTYTANIKPSFRLIMNGSVLTVFYNECGFTKDNVRAITAIGESTKKLLLSGDDRSIGEKGVGFKSVFGVASSVEIHSNGFDFRLTSKLPTVPESCDSIDNSIGTTLVFQMVQEVRSCFTVERILQLCICLRNLKYLEILNHVVTISDDDYRRTVIVDGQRYIFERIIYNFTVYDKEALESRNTNGKEIEPNQQIVCYIPEKVRGQKMLLYSGLPVRIRSNVPLIIDAPFELTTSRDNILHNRWNEIIKVHVYKAILSVMYSKSETGLDVLRYVGFRSQNNIITWQNFDDEFLNNFNWNSALREAKLLPILGSKEKVAVVNQSRCVIVPDFVAKLQNVDDIIHYFNGTVIDIVGKNQYATLLEAIGCEKATGLEILGVLKEKTERFIDNKEFRDGLYAYLSNNQGNTVFPISRGAALNLPIFPVRMVGSTEYISYCHSIFAHSTLNSQKDFYILDTEIMSLKQADDILQGSGRINELTQEVFDAKYEKTLRDYIENKKREHSVKQIAAYVLNEFRNNRNAFTKCKPLLMGLLPLIPFQMSNGLYKKGKKCLNTREQWYVGNLVRTMVVDDKYASLAKFLGCSEVETIHFDDFDFPIDDVLDEDIEDLQYDFNNFYEIILNLVNEGLISDEQISKYHLEFVWIERVGSNDPDEEFPEQPVRNKSKLQRHIQDLWKNHKNPYVEKRYIVWKPESNLDKENYSLNMYQSTFNPGKCFCQMCKKRVSRRYIERNDIERKPVYAWNQMYLSLCLNCSKDYILLRNNDTIYQQFLSNIMGADPLSAGAIELLIGGESVTFTATHLAEVQEILKNEGWGENAPKRKPMIGNSVSNEDEENQLFP